MSNMIWREFIKKPTYEEKIKDLLKDKIPDPTKDMDKDAFIAKWGANSSHNREVIE